MKYLLPGLVILSLAIFSNSQKPTDPPSFSGTWKLKNASKNTSTGSKRVREVGDNILITQSAKKITFVGKSVIQGAEKINSLTFYTDGRGEENSWMERKTPVKTVTKWDNGVLRILETIEMTFHGPTYGVKRANLEIKEEWTLSKDGKKLTHKVKDNWFEIDPMISALGGRSAYSMEVKHVYEREP
jgi:hypothetical protein